MKISFSCKLLQTKTKFNQKKKIFEEKQKTNAQPLNYFEIEVKKKHIFRSGGFSVKKRYHTCKIKPRVIVKSDKVKHTINVQDV